MIWFLFLFISLNGAPIQVPKGSGIDFRKHPGHYPFISWLTFQRYCADWNLGEHTGTFDPAEVKAGDIIFLDYFYLDWFVTYVHDQIQQPYILLTVDKGAWMPPPRAKKLLYDPKLAAWFGRNMVFSGHPKLFQVPMGQDFGYFTHDPDAGIDLIKVALKKPYLKKHILYQNFYPRAHCDRDQIVKIFENQPYCYSINRSDQPWEATPRPLFYEEMAASQFVLSPLGMETDCVRTWEAFVLDTIPVVEHSFLDPLFEGLPIVMVHDWGEVDLPFLERQYQTLKNRNVEKLYFDYWRDQIFEVKRRIQNGDWPYAEWESTHFSTEEVNDFESLLKGKKIDLLYKGFLSTSHPFQLASPSIASLKLYDPWFDIDAYQRIYSQSKDPLEISRLIRASSKVSLLHSEAEFEEQAKWADAVFLDLSYYRHSLFLEHFGYSTVCNGNFRHSLEKDLRRLYDQLQPGTLLLGNKGEDRYVSECLTRFLKERGASLTKKGSFWSIKKG